MARAIAWGIGRNDDDQGPFLAVNVGSDEWNYQVKDLAYAVAKVLPGTKVSINTDAQPDKRSYKVDFSLFRKVAPDHQPQMTLEGTIQELKEGLEAMKFNDSNFRQSNFMRLKMLESHIQSGALSDDLRWNV
jgi:nucleoside-diphosphate-sugar epimerase